jgi:flavin-dependent dehydrogenase
MRDELWDVVIVGAGPAGSVSAALLAERGWRVLLLERSPWPREKVCGGCLNAAAIAMLREAGLERAIRSGRGLRQFALNVRGKRLELSLPEGVAIPRDLLDQRLVEEATQRGCAFQAGVTASLLPSGHAGEFRTVRLTKDGASEDVRARLVLACDGIGGTLLEHEPWATWRVAGNSWFGVATTIDNEPTLVANGTIGMHVGRGGYVGTVRYNDGRVHIAAAMSAASCRTAGGPAKLVETIFRECGVTERAQSGAARFHGTGLLTRRRLKLGGHRVLAVGDACGYVEPFTGEGIAWAIRGAKEVVQVLPKSSTTWSQEIPAAWARRHRAVIGMRQQGCTLLRQALHRPALARFSIAIATGFPAVSAALVRQIGQQSVTRFSYTQGVGE